ncbi:hypothetical protein J1N35_008867 [Gossypium stocksii]|uniref:Uncharacterized protein n=1 Tax=Gossypium stocksii TaxID=47602 RepID=A0A9D3W8Z9_9ROSI|nr:hypothetical protein J1N35_008867 [Gossypium stocksii]
MRYDILTIGVYNPKAPIISEFGWAVRLPAVSVKTAMARKILGFDKKINGFGGKFGIFRAWGEEKQLEELDDTPLTIELQQICSESQFGIVIVEVQQLKESLIILWYCFI